MKPSTNRGASGSRPGTVTRSHAYGAKAIDVDLIGYCPECLDTLYLIEATRGRQRKTAAVLEHLGHQLNVPVLVVYQDKTGGHPEQILVDRRYPDRDELRVVTRGGCVAHAPRFPRRT
jgi:hypothetical protein